MEKIKARIEEGFERAGHFFYRHPVPVLIILFAFVALLALQIPRMTVDTSSEALLHANDPDRVDFNSFRDQFGRSEVIIIGARAENIFSPNFFARLKAFTEDLEENTPYIKEVTSLINIRETKGDADELIVEDLTEEWPETPEDFEALRKRVSSNTLYRNHVISDDHKTAAIILETEAVVGVGPDPGNELDSMDALDDFEEAAGLMEENPSPDAQDSETRYFSEAENELVVAAVKKIVQRHEGEGFELVFSGGPAIQDVFNKTVMSDTRLCVLLALITNILFLAVLFRRVSGVLLPVLIVFSALLCTMGLFPVFNVPFKLTGTIIPAFLVAVGVADSVHILAIFYRRLNEGATREEAICHSLGHSGLAVFMTSMTTAAGLLSFSMAELTALAELGIFAATGVMIAFLFTVVMLPSALALFPIKAAKGGAARTMLMDRFLLFFARFSTARPWVIVIVCMALFAFPAFYLPRLVFSDDVVAYLPDDMEERVNILDLDHRLKGVMAMEAVIDFGRSEALYEPKSLHDIEAFIREVEKIKIGGLFVGKVISINDVVKEINQAMGDNAPANYAIPDDRQAIAQELLLFENSGSDDLERIVDSQFSKTRVTIKLPWADSVVYEAALNEVRRIFDDIFGPNVSLTLTGELALMAKTIPVALRSMTKSYGIAFVVITIMMILLVGHLKTGLISMFPNLLPIVLVMGLISFVGITLNLNTLMIGSIAMGLVVDDTMHFLYNFRRFRRNGHDAKKSVRYTLLGTGRALLITSMVLCGGFLVLLAATLKTSIQFGIFTALILILALLADFVLAPALMVILSRK